MQTYVDQITLDCLLNKEMYKDHVTNKKMAKINREEHKLYKKRIYQLFKESIIGSQPEDLPMDVKYAYNNYLNACIQYFKIKDKHDTIQSEFKDFIFTEEENQIVQDVSLNEVNQIENNLEADKILIFSTFDKNSAKQEAKSTSEKGSAKLKSKLKTEAASFMFSKILTKDK